MGPGFKNHAGGLVRPVLGPQRPVGQKMGWGPGWRRSGGAVLSGGDAGGLAGRGSGWTRPGQGRAASTTDGNRAPWGREWGDYA